MATRSPRITYAWIGVIALSCVVYITGIGHESACYDEVVANAIARHRFVEIFGLLTYDNHPPLFYLLLWLVRPVLGSSEWALRVVPTAAAVGLVALGAGPVRRLLGDRIALLYAGVVLFTPAYLIYAHEARMYTPATLAVTAATLYGVLAVRDGRISDWVKFGVSSLAAAYLHYYALFAVFFANAFLLGWVLFQRRERLKPALTTGALVAVAYLPWVAMVVRQALTVKRGGFWVSPVSFQSVVLVLLRPFTYKEIVPDVRWWMLAALAVWLLLIAWGILMAWKREARLERTVGALVAIVYLGTMTATIGISLFFVPVFFYRYMIVCTGGLVLLVSMGMARLPRTVWQGLAVALLALLNVATLRDVYTEYFNYGMRKVAQDLRGAVQPGDLVITTESFSLGPALYYFPQAENYYSDNSHEERWGQILNVFIPPLHYKMGLKELLSTRQSFWHITCSIPMARDISEILGDDVGWEKADEGKTYPEPFSWCSYTVTKYLHTGRKSDKSTLKIHVTNLKPLGGLFVILFDRGPLDAKSTPPVRFEYLHVSGPELAVSFSSLSHKDYALMVWHDENENRKPDLDDQGRPAEGFFVYNSEKMSWDGWPSAVTQPPRFDAVKFALTEPSRTIEAKMVYPPR